MRTSGPARARRRARRSPGRCRRSGGADGEHGGALCCAEPLQTALDGSVLLPHLRRTARNRWSEAVRRPCSHKRRQRRCTYFSGALDSLMAVSAQVTAVTSKCRAAPFFWGQKGSTPAKWSSQRRFAWIGAAIKARSCGDTATACVTSSAIPKWSARPARRARRVHGDDWPQLQRSPDPSMFADHIDPDFRGSRSAC